MYLFPRGYPRGAFTDIRVERGRLSVVAGLHCLSGRGLVLLPVKTKRSHRHAVLAPEVVQPFRMVCVWQLEQRLALDPAWNQTGFVFTKPYGRSIDSEKVTHGFKRIIDKGGLSGVHPS